LLDDYNHLYFEFAYICHPMTIPWARIETRRDCSFWFHVLVIQLYLMLLL